MIAWVVLALTGCAPAPTQAPSADHVAYIATLEADYQSRVDRLASETGWLTLVALTWLDKGTHAIGSAQDSAVIVPEYSAPAQLGTLTRTGTEVGFEPAGDLDITADGAPITDTLILRSDAHEDGPAKVVYNTLTFYVIERQGKIGIRAKDSAHPARAAFDGIPRFAPEASFKVTARLALFDEPRLVAYPTAIGTTDKASVPGELHFEIAGTTHVLLPFQDAPDEDMFIVFADKTSGIETYGGGRFLGASPADAEGRVILDFNTATNPPCAFTPFATCPLPPTDNRLAVRIEAGEKTPAGH